MKQAHIVAIATLFVFAMGSAPAPAQEYPTKPVRVVVPYTPGGNLDNVIRLISYKLAERWRQQLIIDNRGGSGGALGTSLAVKAPPDGHTLLIANGGPITVYPHLRTKPLYRPERDLKPITYVCSSPMLLVVPPPSPIKSISDVVRIAKARPNELRYGSGGVGNLQHFAMEVFQSMADVKMIHVPYKGNADALLDIYRGQIDLSFSNIMSTLPAVKAGRARMIAVSSATPSALAPDVPPVATVYPEFDLTAWVGFFAPSRTPDDLIAKINRDLLWVISLPEMKKRLIEQGATIVAGGPAELAAFTHKESILFEKIVKIAGIPKD